MRTKKIKLFEALIGTEWKSWGANDTTEIKKSGGKVIMTAKVNNDNYKGVLTTEFDLTKFPAHSIGT